MKLIVGGERVVVNASPAPDGIDVSVDGETFHLKVDEVAQATFVLRDGDSISTFYCIRSQGVVHLSFRGVTYQLPEEPEGSGRVGARPSGGGLETPMPGKVIKLHVGLGDCVVKGQEILVVEAMKMENVVRAPADGTVSALRVKEGDMVAPGTILVELT
jgi:biotin carboxyl carrier protein